MENSPEYYNHLLDKMSNDELGKLFPISIVPCNPEWPDWYLEEKSLLTNILNDNLRRIEHIGSTAVPDLAAKPTIDILIDIPVTEDTKSQIKKIMQKNGHHFILRTDHPPPYMMFVKGYSIAGYQGRVIHVHIAPKDHAYLWDGLLFRNYLLNHGQIA